MKNNNSYKNIMRETIEIKSSVEKKSKLLQK